MKGYQHRGEGQKGEEAIHLREPVTHHPDGCFLREYIFHKKCYPFIGGAADKGRGGSDPAEAFGNDFFGLLGFGFEWAGFTGIGGEVVGGGRGAGAAGDDVDVKGAPFIPKGLRKDFQKRLSGGVRGEECGALEARDGAHHDDAAAAAFDHLTAKMVEEGQWGVHVDGGDLVVGREAGGEKWADMGGGCVEDKEIDLPVGCCRDDFPGRVFGGEVDGEGENGDPELLGELAGYFGQGFGAAGDKDEVETLRGERMGPGGAETFGGSGDE